MLSGSKHNQMSASHIESRNSAEPRLSQRQPHACRECTRRKVKCDKKIPCSRCKRLDKECARELVRVRKQVERHGSEIEFLRGLKKMLKSTGGDGTGIGNADVLRELKKRILKLESGSEERSQMGSDEADNPDANSNFMPSGRSSSITTPTVNFVCKSGYQKEKDATIVTVLEYLVWGRHYGSCYPHRTCSCHSHRSQCEMISIDSRPKFIGSPQQSLLQDWGILPSIVDATKLIRFHGIHLAWHHNCLHFPTFIGQCENFWRLGTCDHPLWMALYLSVLSCSIWCAQNSRKFQAALDLDCNDDTAVNLFRGMVEVLYAGNSLENLSLYSVQAIAISTEVAHNLGVSNLNATLSSAAIRVGQCMGLHNISNEQSLCHDPTDKWHETIEREVGKRLWCQIVIQDHFAIPFTDSYCINPSHFSTTLPMNCDDHDMEERDDSIPTISSYTRILGQMATLIPPLLDDLGPLRTRNPLQEQYQRVVETDHRMRELVGNIPSFLLRRNLNEPEFTPWLDIARRSLAITAADKIIMIHRPFLFQSFQSPQYAHTRNTCVSAAITILREHSHITTADDVSIWTHSAFCVTAAVVLGLELLYPRRDNPEKTSNYWHLIKAARERLANRRGDVMADRGVRLIETILQEAGLDRDDRMSRREIDFRKILGRFLSLDDSLSGESNAEHFEIDLSLPNSDFDVWLNQVFGYDEI